MELATINITSFEEKPDQPATVTIGGATATGKRVEAYRVATPVFLEASKRLLKPSLDAVLEESHENLRRFIQSLDDAKQQAIEAHTLFAREQRKLFAMRAGQATNHTLDETATVTVEATVPPS